MAVYCKTTEVLENSSYMVTYIIYIMQYWNIAIFDKSCIVAIVTLTYFQRSKLMDQKKGPSG